MARPLRPQWQVRTVVRRRHRTWMAAMILATWGWGFWWLGLAVHRFAPGWFPGLVPIYVLTSTLAAVGLFLAIFTVRARAIWILLASVPILANLSLLLLPAVVGPDILDAIRR